jgi:hypothetical protein
MRVSPGGPHVPPALRRTRSRQRRCRPGGPDLPPRQLMSHATEPPPRSAHPAAPTRGPVGLLHDHEPAADVAVAPPVRMTPAVAPSGLHVGGSRAAPGSPPAVSLAWLDRGRRVWLVQAVFGRQCVTLQLISRLVSFSLDWYGGPRLMISALGVRRSRPEPVAVPYRGAPRPFVGPPLPKTLPKPPPPLKPHWDYGWQVVKRQRGVGFEMAPTAWLSWGSPRRVLWRMEAWADPRGVGLTFASGTTSTYVRWSGAPQLWGMVYVWTPAPRLAARIPLPLTNHP